MTIRNSRITNKDMALKSQDVVVALKLCLGGSALPYADLSTQLGISVSEVHAAVKRLEEGGLIPAMGIAELEFGLFLKNSDRL